MDSYASITHSQFVKALEELPFIALIDKACEITNSLRHLKSSNDQLAEFPEDPDCLQAITENKEVTTRFLGRLQSVQDELLKRPNGMHLPKDYTELTGLLRKEIEKDVDSEVTAFENAMKAKYGDDWTEADKPTAEPSSLASNFTVTEDTTISDPEEQDIPSVAGTIKSTSHTTQDQTAQQTEKSGRYTDADLSQLLNRRMEEMGVDESEDTDVGVFL